MIGGKSNEVRAIPRVVWKPCKRHLTQTWRQWYLPRLLGSHESWTKSLRISKHYLRWSKTGRKQARELERAGSHVYSWEHEIRWLFSRDFKQHDIESMWFEVDNTETWGWSSVLGPVQIIHYAKAFEYYPHVKKSAQ